VTRVRVFTAAVVGQCLIVVTGGVVRLTSSGLGCPTWPRCTQDSFVPVARPGADSSSGAEVHVWIEFGNRLVALALGAVCVLCVVLAHRCGPPGARSWAWLQLAGVVGQGVVGGVSVLADLTPLVVAAHFVLSTALIYVSLRLRHHMQGPRSSATRAAARATSARPADATLAAVVVTVGLGTLLTAAGPHSGGTDVDRLDLDVGAFAVVHGAAALLALASVMLTGLALATARAPSGVRRLAVVTFTLLCGQLTTGAVQYSTGLPIAVVAVHLLGAAVCVACAAQLQIVTRAPRTPAARGLLDGDGLTAGTRSRTSGTRA
jgi:cytochrome c oxidase assembly protein subunit 15